MSTKSDGRDMKFYKNLYIGNTITNPERIKRKLKLHKKILPPVYIIACAKENKQLEIYSSLLLEQWYYKENPPYVIGIAGSEEEAFEIIRQIAEEAIQLTGKPDLVDYLF